MASASKVATFTADGQSDIKILKGFIFNSTTADTLDLRQGGSGGTISMSLVIAAAGVAVVPLGDGIACPSGNWYVDVTTTGSPKITLWGD
jgi:hypothetical protein